MTSIDRGDQQWLLHMGSVAGAIDPPPPLLLELGRAAFSLRRVDAELIELVDDSADELVGVRGATSQERLLSFEGRAVSLDLQVTVEAGHVRLIGQVVPVPAGGAVVHVESPDRPVASTDVDTVGGFAIDEVPEGLLRLRIERGGEVAVTTAWIRP